MLFPKNCFWMNLSEFGRRRKPSAFRGDHYWLAVERRANTAVFGFAKFYTFSCGGLQVFGEQTELISVNYDAIVNYLASWRRRKMVNDQLAAVRFNISSRASLARRLFSHLKPRRPRENSFFRDFIGDMWWTFPGWTANFWPILANICLAKGKAGYITFVLKC